jgi:hypothetical protein
MLSGYWTTGYLGNVPNIPDLPNILDLLDLPDFPDLSNLLNHGNLSKLSKLEITPPPLQNKSDMVYRTHIRDSLLTVISIVAIIYTIRIIFTRIISRYIIKVNEVIEHGSKVTQLSRDMSMSIISILFCTIVSTFGIVMTWETIKNFIHEILEAYRNCGISIIYAQSDCHNFCIFQKLYTWDIGIVPLTEQLIDSMDSPYHSQQVISLSLWIAGYFLYDMLFNNQNKESVIHHVFCLICITVHICSNMYTFYVCCAMVTELSTIFLSCSVFFKRNTRLKDFWMLLFAIVFSVTRIGFIPIVICIVWFVERGGGFLIPFAVFVALFVLNVYWFCLIVRKSVKKIKN